MGRIEDVSRTEVKLKSALKRLKDSEILDANKQLISNFYFSLRRENLKKNTQASHINTLTETCKIYQSMGIVKALPDITIQEFDIFIFYLEDEKHYKPGTINVFKKSFKKFMKWYYGDSTPFWVHSDIKLQKCEGSVQPQDIPSTEEFAEFLEEARHPRNAAIIAVAADGGLRIGALSSCTVQSVNDAHYGVILYLSRDGSNKTTPPKGIPLTWSSGYLQRWLVLSLFKCASMMF